MVLIIALFPVVALLAFIYFVDKYQHEPWPEILKAVGAGVLSALLVLSVVLSLNMHFDVSVSGAVADAFFNAAIPEELAKLLMLWLVLKTNRYFDEYFDGFAGLENILYLVGEEDWMAVGIARGIFSVPAHFLFGVAMGYYYSLVHFQRNVTDTVKWMQRVCVVAVPIILHGSFDTFLMVASHTAATDMNIPLAGACVAGFIIICIFMAVFAFRKCKKLLEIDKQYFDAIAKQQINQYWNF